MPMETVLNLLLVRFALIAGGLVVLALVVFAVALVLKRRGRLDDVRRLAAPAARAAVRHLDDRRATRRGSASAAGVLLAAALRSAARTLDDRTRR
jgi:heme exporter protein D